jgi:hypothetical protein
MLQQFDLSSADPIDAVPGQRGLDGALYDDSVRPSARRVET